MNFSDDGARKVFRAYAFPCLEVRVSRGDISKNEARELIHGYPLHRLDEDIENKYFPRAVGRCTIMAKDMGKESIDTEAIRLYFRFQHDRHVDEEAREGHVRNAAYCKVWPGIVVKITEGMHADVATPIDFKEYRTELVRGIGVGNHVFVHRGFISEITDERTYNEAHSVKVPASRE